MYYIGASEFGSCIKMLVLHLTNPDIKKPEPEYLRRAAQEGAAHEPLIRNEMAKNGIVPQDPNGAGICIQCQTRFGNEREGYHVEYELVQGELTVVGHMDDYLFHTATGRWFMGEYKALGKTSFDRLLPDLSNYRKYGFQASLYHHGTGLPIMYARKSRDSGRLEFAELQPPFSLPDIHARALELVKYLQGNEVPKCDVLNKDLMDNWGCDDKVCGPDKHGLQPKPDTEVEGSISQAIRSIRSAIKMTEAAKLLRGEAERVLKQELTRVGEKSLERNRMQFQLVKKRNFTYDMTEEDQDTFDTHKREMARLRAKNKEEVDPTEYLKITDKLDKES